MSIAKLIDNRFFRTNKIAQSSLFFFILLFTFDWINEDKLITFYKWPNFGDNYFFPVFLLSLGLINFKKIQFTKLDKIIVIFLVCFKTSFALFHSFAINAPFCSCGRKIKGFSFSLQPLVILQ